MPTDKPLPVKTALVSRIYLLEAQLAEARRQLVALGAGPYVDPETRQRATVVAGAPKTTFSLYGTDHLAPILEELGVKKASPEVLRMFRGAREQLGREICGDEFGQLFDRQVLHVPTSSFVALAPKLLTPARAEKILSECKTVGKQPKPSIRLPDKEDAEPAEDE